MTNNLVKTSCSVLRPFLMALVIALAAAASIQAGSVTISSSGPGPAVELDPATRSVLEWGWRPGTERNSARPSRSSRAWCTTRPPMPGFVTSGSTLQVNTSFTNTGMVNIGELHGPSASLFQMVGANSFVQTSGTTTLWASNSTLAVASGQTVSIQGGLLQGFGTIQGNLINGGTVHPGDGPGTLTINGNYTQNSAGILDIQIGGTTPGTEFSVLNVSGLATLSAGSVLDVSLLNGFIPTSNDTFVILTSGGLSGTFTDDTIQLGNVTFSVEYSPAGYLNDVVLGVQISSVPEPASLLMLGIGIAGIGAYVARRRRNA